MDLYEQRGTEKWEFILQFHLKIFWFSRSVSCKDTEAAYSKTCAAFLCSAEDWAWQKCDTWQEWDWSGVGTYISFLPNTDSLLRSKGYALTCWLIKNLIYTIQKQQLKKPHSRKLSLETRIFLLWEIDKISSRYIPQLRLAL